MKSWFKFLLLMPLIHGCFSPIKIPNGIPESFVGLSLGNSTERINVWDRMSCIESYYEIATDRTLILVRNPNGLWSVRYNIIVTERCVVLGSKTSVLANISDNCQISESTLFETLIQNVHCCSIEDTPQFMEHYSGTFSICSRENNESLGDCFDLVRPSSVTDLWNRIKQESIGEASGTIGGNP